MHRGSLQRRFTGALALMLIPLVLVGLAGIAAVRISVGAFADAAHEHVKATAPLNRLHERIRMGEDAAAEAHIGSGEQATFDHVAAGVAAELSRLRDAAGGRDATRALDRAVAAWEEARGALADQLDRPLLERVTDVDALDRFDERVRATELGIQGAELAAAAKNAAALRRAETTEDHAQLVIAMLMLLGLTTALLVGHKLAGALLAPIRRLEEGARRIGAGDLSHRVGDGTADDELGALAAAFDSMASDIEAAETALRDSQERLIQTQKLEAVGQLAGGIAHDFNNLLLVVGSYADFLHESFDETDPRRDDASEIRKAADRAAALTRQLLTFSRRDVSQPVALDPAEVVSRIEAMLRRTLAATIDLRIEIEPELPAVVIDAGQLEQVLLNLVLNAQSAMPDGGALTIGVRKAALGEEGIPQDVPPGSYISIAVADTGQGMTEEVRNRAFEPFFSTRTAEGGSGLGLATVYGIVTDAGGAVTLESGLGDGTTVTLYLPASSAVAEPAAVPPPDAVAANGGSKVVLLAEDEPTIRRLTERILSAHGYEVIAAGSGGDALALAEDAVRLDVLLTDVVMPGMTGTELSQEMTRLRPGTPTVFMSGYSDQIVGRHGILEANVLYLRKPFTRQELLEAIEQAAARVTECVG